MFGTLIKKKYKKCNTKEDYENIRKDLENYGIEKFYYEMEKLRVFKDGKINRQNNPFVQMMYGERRNDFKNFQEFLLIKNIDNHYLLTPRLLEWDSFNILTLSQKHIYLLKRMKYLALEFIKNQKWENYSLYFHCYPFNSVNALHLHIVKTSSKITSKTTSKNNDLSFDIVLDFISNIKEFKNIKND